MERIARTVAFTSLILVLLSTACSAKVDHVLTSDEKSVVNDNSNLLSINSELGSDENLLSQVEEALQGTWLYSGDGFIQKVAFDNGDVTSLLISNGIEYVNIGFYDLSDGIDTTNFNSDGSYVKGHLSYTYDSGILKLIAANGSYLIKISDDNSLTWGADAIIHSGTRQDVKEDNSSKASGRQNSHLSPGDSITKGEWNALARAKEYLSFMAFSYNGLIEQLEFEGYSHSEAVYGADNCNADWKEQAVIKAAEYLGLMPFSREGLIDQLEFEGFTHAQAVYGAEQNGY